MLRRLVKDCEGQDLVEYGLLVALTLIGAVAAVSAFSSVIAAAWTAISNNLSS